MSSAGLRRAFHLAACALPLGAPAIAEACAVCTAGRDAQSQTAFILTTIFMSAMPLLLVGGLVYWLIRRIRSQEAAHDAARHRARVQRTGEAELPA